MKYLWIEDFNEGRARAEKEPYWRKLYGLSEDFDVILKINLTQALEYIDNQQNDFDAVIIDINLDLEDEVLGGDYFQYIKKTVSKEYIQKDPGDLKRMAGFLVFLKLILDRGFPIHRMAFLTGNYTEDDTYPDIAEELIDLVLKVRNGAPECNNIKEVSRLFTEDEIEEYQYLVKMLESLDIMEKASLGQYFKKGEGSIDEALKYLEARSYEKEEFLKKRYKENSQFGFNGNPLNEYNVYKITFSSAGIKPSKPFIKENEVHTKRFHRWKNQISTDYLQMRRSIIEISKSLLNLIEKKPQLFIFNQIHSKENNSSHSFGLNDMKEMLHMLPLILAINEPREKQKLFQQILQLISHPWDTKIAQYPRRFEKEKYSLNLHCIMKLLRNWMAHTKINEELTPADVGFLFMIAIRTYFDLGYQMESEEEDFKKIFFYEKKLLQLQDNKIEKYELIKFIKGYAINAKEWTSDLEKILKMSFTSITKREIRANRYANSAGYNVYSKFKNIGKEDSIEPCKIKDFYRLFWHTIFYSRWQDYKETTEDLTQLKVCFTINRENRNLDEKEFLTQMFLYTFKNTFEKEIVELQRD